ncbi:MAG: glucose-6-phosphate isomerase [Bacillota bacterium]|nr:glucose-6-phosphate isomerase [Bacillota bacterium]
MIKVNLDGCGSLELNRSKALEAVKMLKEGTGKGNDYIGWTTLPFDYDKDEFDRIIKAAEKIRKDADALVVIGIGGSYLGARAVIELLKTARHNEIEKPAIYFIGNGIDGADLNQVLELIKNKNVYVNVISKSGTTLEPALAFRIIREYMEKTYGKEEAANRIFATTDKARGALKSLADAEGYETFVVPDNIGGRYSVLTAVGLLPIAAAGIDIKELMAGAETGIKEALSGNDDAASVVYACARQALYNNGKKVEILSYPGENYRFMAEWYKQLYGESEGKAHLGIYPSSCELTADLHSLGQYIQDGERILFETIFRFEKETIEVTVPFDEANGDGLNYVAGKKYSEVFKAAAAGVKQAHITGGVPVIELIADDVSARSLGEIIAFFEAACGISGYMQGVNPFDQPGVEEYKKNMFALLGKK